MDHAHVIQSFERCRKQPTFLDRFYELFLASSPDVAEKFRDTDFEQQKKALIGSLEGMLLATEMGGLLKIHLKTVADSHSRTRLDISPGLYDLWADCLMSAVREHDPQLDDALEQAWRAALQPGIEFMRSRY
jgi:hemoglobin-like flavoprotein